ECACRQERAARQGRPAAAAGRNRPRPGRAPASRREGRPRMTVSALTRPGQRDRLSEKIGEIDWRLAAMLAFIAGVGAMMLYSIAGGSWEPWADKHLIRFFLLFAVMIVLSLIDLKVWYALAYPVYGLALVLLLATAVVGQSHLGARRWLGVGHLTMQPSEV